MHFFSASIRRFNTSRALKKAVSDTSKAYLMFGASLPSSRIPIL